MTNCLPHSLVEELSSKQGILGSNAQSERSEVLRSFNNTCFRTVNKYYHSDSDGSDEDGNDEDTRYINNARHSELSLKVSSRVRKFELSFPVLRKCMIFSILKNIFSCMRRATLPDPSKDILIFWKSPPQQTTIESSPVVIGRYDLIDSSSSVFVIKEINCLLPAPVQT